MKQERLNLYLIDMKYVRDLAKADTNSNVMSVSPQVGKASRPFIGVIIVCNTFKYCVPLSSPKEKHKTMKNDVDFMKIVVADKILGVLNFNNMIPVDERFISRFNMLVSPSDDAQTVRYKRMAAKQLTFCQQNQDQIIKRANKLHEMILSGRANRTLQRRCCDFAALEATLLKKLHN